MKKWTHFLVSSVFLWYSPALVFTQTIVPDSVLIPSFSYKNPPIVTYEIKPAEIVEPEFIIYGASEFDPPLIIDFKPNPTLYLAVGGGYEGNYGGYFYFNNPHSFLRFQTENRYRTVKLTQGQSDTLSITLKLSTTTPQNNRLNQWAGEFGYRFDTIRDELPQRKAHSSIHHIYYQLETGPISSYYMVQKTSFDYHQVSFVSEFSQLSISPYLETGFRLNNHKLGVYFESLTFGLNSTGILDESSLNGGITYSFSNNSVLSSFKGGLLTYSDNKNVLFPVFEFTNEVNLGILSFNIDYQSLLTQSILAGHVHSVLPSLSSPLPKGTLLSHHRIKTRFRWALTKNVSLIPEYEYFTKTEQLGFDNQGPIVLSLKNKGHYQIITSWMINEWISVSGWLKGYTGSPLPYLDSENTGIGVKLTFKQFIIESGFSQVDERFKSQKKGDKLQNFQQFRFIFDYRHWKSLNLFVELEINTKDPEVIPLSIISKTQLLIGCGLLF